MEMNRKISVIVPVYNKEKYLPETLDSILRQTYEEYELIVVNDGSTDSTSEILAQYQKRFSGRMKVITQNNRGVSSARNAGAEEACGDMALFFDADDLMEPDMLRVLAETAENEQADLVTGSYLEIDERGNVLKNCLFPESFTMKKPEQLMAEHTDPFEEKRQLMTLMHAMPFPGNKLYSLSRIREWKLQFEPYRVGEDLDFYLRYLARSRCTAVAGQILCRYRKSPDMVSLAADERILDIIKSLHHTEVSFHGAVSENILSIFPSVKVRHYYYQINKFQQVKGRSERYRVLTLLGRAALAEEKPAMDGVQDTPLEPEIAGMLARIKKWYRERRILMFPEFQEKIIPFYLKGKEASYKGRDALLMSFYRKNLHGNTRKPQILILEDRDGYLRDPAQRLSENILRRRGGTACMLAEKLAGRRQYHSWKCIRSKDQKTTEQELKENSPGLHTALAESRVIITDGVLPFWYVKQKEQIVIKFWNPLPFPETQEALALWGKEQKTCCKADYLILPEEMKQSFSTGLWQRFYEMGLDSLYTGVFIASDSLEEIAGRITENPEQNDRDESIFRCTDKRKNVLLYAGGLLANGMTAALKNLLAQPGVHREYNYFLALRYDKITNYPDCLKDLKDRIRLVVISPVRNKGIAEFAAVSAYFKRGKSYNQAVREDYYKRQYQANFGGFRFDNVIQYSGYDRDVMHILMEAPVRKVLFLHSDVKSEIELKRNMHEPTLKEAFDRFDVIAAVTEPVKYPALQMGAAEEKLKVVPNCIPAAEIRQKSLLPLRFDAETRSTHSREKLLEILYGKQKKYINVGRYSPEKGHFMLIDAFDALCHEIEAAAPAAPGEKEDPDLPWLLIIGGYGPLYEKTCAHAASRKSRERIILIENLTNPFPVVRQCDLFVLSSTHEALGLAMLEAVVLGVPVVSTDLPGPAFFLKKYGGKLVPPSADDIKKAMEMEMKNSIPPLHVDFDRYNQEAVRQFTEVLKGKYSEEQENPRC